MNPHNGKHQLSTRGDIPAGYYKSKMCGMILRKHPLIAPVRTERRAEEPAIQYGPSLVFRTDASWTPSTYRAAHRAWSANAPENDGEIMPKARGSRRKLTTAEAQRFSPLRTFLNGAPVETLSSNWSIVPDNDNRSDSDDNFDDEYKAEANWRPERSHEIIPSLPLLETNITGVEVRYRKEPSMLSGGRLDAMRAHRNEEGIPIGGDFERNAHGQIVRIGGLQFAGADEYGINPTEWTECLGEGGVVVMKRLRMRTGAMMYSKEVRKDIKETTNAAARKKSNDYFLNFVLPSPKRSSVQIGTIRRSKCDLPNPPTPPTSLTFEEARAWAGLPYIARDKQAALPATPKRLADLFIGCKKVDCHGGGSQAWSDVASALVGKEQWDAAMAEMSKIDLVSLTAVRSAKNYADIGKAHGHSGSYAEKAGKRLLIAANDNLGAIIKKIAA